MFSQNTLNTYSRRWPHERGASLLDALIVVTVMGIVVVLAVPLIGPALELQRLDSAAAKVVSKLSEARLAAIGRNASVWLHIDSTASTLQLQTISGGSTVNIGPAEPLPSRISIGGSPAQVTFNSLGRLTSAQTIILTGASSRKTETVSVSVQGNITVSNMN